MQHNPKAGRNLWTWDELRAAGANVKPEATKPKPHIEVLNRTNRTTYVVKRKKAA